ncbi:MAG: LysR family transcriptional regulator [Acidimicrobiia bacterium]
MELHHLRCALAIVEHGSFTKAAAALHMSQSALSHAIARLEADLGTSLFLRLGRRVELTPAGQALIDPATKAIEHADDVRAAVASTVGVVAGELDLVVVQIALTTMTRLVSAFRARYPGVSVRLHDPGDDPDVRRQLRDGRSEVGIVRLRGRAAQLRVEPLLDIAVVAIVPEGSALSSRASVTVAELAKEPLVAPSQGSFMRSRFDAAFGDAAADRNIVVECPTHESLLDLVRQGAGCSMTAEESALLVPGVVAVPLRPRRRIPVGLAYRPGRLSPAASAFIRVAHEHHDGTGRSAR